VCDLETSRIGAPYIYDISTLRVNNICWVTSMYFQGMWLLMPGFLQYSALILYYIETPHYLRFLLGAGE
jgi:hypothetical protein